MSTLGSIHMSAVGVTSGTGPPDGDLPLAVRQRLHRRARFALPVIAIVPVVLAVVLATTLAPVRAGAAALGAAGWLVSVALRGPAGALASSRMPKQAVPTLTLPALLSGPAEELIRLLLVLVGVHGFASLLWAGFGWGTVEVASTLVTAVGVRRLLLDPSDKAAEARRGMVSMGWLQYVQSLVPVLGAVERAAVSLLQIGFTRCWAGIPGWCWSPYRRTVP
jgi:hypothetical protein